jgi:hypothetical protein
MSELPAGCDLFRLEDRVWVLEQHTNNTAYDFAFDSIFACRRPWRRPDRLTAIARVGAPLDYSSFYHQCAGQGVTLINSPTQHQNASELPEWYPCIKDVTPRSSWFESPPEPRVVADVIGWPVFVKGARQTSRHDPAKAVARNAVEYEQLIEKYRQDAILSWQRCVIREFVELRPVSVAQSLKIRPSFEFRTFWLHKQLVGAGPYWSQFASYSWTPDERDACLSVAASVVERVDCPFLVVDMAQTAEGRWIVIECNDAQESGYAGVSPFSLWNALLRVAERDIH